MDEGLIKSVASPFREVISQHGRPACASAFAAFDDSSFTSTASTVTGCVLPKLSPASTCNPSLGEIYWLNSIEVSKPWSLSKTHSM